MTEIWVNSETGDDASLGTEAAPYKTTPKAVSMLSGDSDRLHLHGTFTEGLKLSGRKWAQKLLVEGGGSLLYGFEGPPGPLDPISLPNRSWGILSVSDCHNVHIKDLEVVGGAMECVHLDDSYPTIGLKNVKLEGVTAKYGRQRGFFMGGHNISGISLIDCTAVETCYGDTTHGFYLSGGHWRGDYPPVTDVRLIGCKASYSGGRHGIQLNGRFKDVLISRVSSWHNQRTSLSLIGVQDALVEDCQFYGNNDQGMVIYDYFDYATFDPSDPLPWKACHHRTKDIRIKNCTIVVGHNRWKKDQYHYHSPVNKPAILVNTNLGAMFPEYKPEGIVVQDCILMTPFSNIIEYGHSYDASATKVMGNLCHAKQGAPEVRVTGKHQYELADLQQKAQSCYFDNIIESPKFAQAPKYDYIDLTVVGSFDFSMHHSIANLYSAPGFNNSKGAPIPHPKVPIAENTVNGTAGEIASLPWEERERSESDSEEGPDPFEVHRG